jgi:hypothetical protein
MPSDGASISRKPRLNSESLIKPRVYQLRRRARIQ